MNIRTGLHRIGALRIVLLALLVVLMITARAGGGGSGDSPAETDGPPDVAAGLPVEEAVEGVVEDANSADRVLFWVNVRAVQDMTDAELATWKRRGVDGFVLSTQWLAGIGGNSRFTAEPGAALDGPDYDLQRSLRDSRLVARAKAQGMKLYLGFYLSSRSDARTPLADWFDDAGWTGTILPRVSELAGAARLLGFDGLAVDSELYPRPEGSSTASWENRYPGNTRSIDDTRRAAFERGRQLMTTILESFPEVEIQVYAAVFPESWGELVQEKVNGRGGFARLLHLPFWDGMSSAEGYRAIRFSESIFYKTTHIRGSTWETANQYNVNRLYALFSRELSNWGHASSRVFVSPFAWIDGGTSEFERARPPSYVADQLDAFRTWATGGELLVYAQGLQTFDYGPYLAGLRAASTPAVVDTVAPTLRVESAVRTGDTLRVTGAARDNLGIRSVLVGDRPAAMTWRVTGGDYDSEWEWEMDWELAGATVAPGATSVTVTAVDIKGLSSTVAVPLGP